MKRQRIVFWTGLLIYSISFFLPAILGCANSTPPIRGYDCALIAFISPIENGLQNAPWHAGSLFQSKSLEYFSLLLSGWVNPLFLIEVILILVDRLKRVVVALGLAIVLMIPFSWVVFHYEHYCPREGHIVWIVGILVVLFSGTVDLKS